MRTHYLALLAVSLLAQGCANPCSQSNSMGAEFDRAFDFSNYQCSYGPFGNAKNLNQTTFNPKDLSGLSLWLSADTVSGANNSSVSAWTDSSSNAYSFTQSFALNQPTLNTSVAAANHHNTITVGGTNETYLYPGTDPAANAGLGAIFDSGSYTVVVVARLANVGFECINAESSICPVISMGNVQFGSEPYENGGLFFSSGNDIGSNLYGQVGNDTAFGSFQIATYSVNLATPVAQAYLNGTLQTMSFPNDGINFDEGNGASNVTDDNFVIGQGSFGGFDGDIAQILIYNRVLSSTERVELECYLASIYNITDTSCS